MEKNKRKRKMKKNETKERKESVPVDQLIIEGGGERTADHWETRSEDQGQLLRWLVVKHWAAWCDGRQNLPTKNKGKKEGKKKFEIEEPVSLIWK